MKAALGLGSNLGDRKAHLERALAALARRTRLVARSRFHETAPVGGPPQPDYLNAAAIVEWEGGARDLFRITREIEADEGRTRGVRNGPRTLDIDILLLDGLELREPDLEIPHPRLLARRFALEPLCEIAPRWIVPGDGRTVEEALADLLRHP